MAKMLATSARQEGGETQEMKNTPIAKRLIKDVKKNGYDIVNGFRQIGIILDHTTIGQLSYSAISSINQYMELNFGTSFCIFSIENTANSIVPNFPIFGTKELRGFSGSIIATSAKTAVELAKAVRCRKYWYLYDLEWLRPWGRDVQADAERIMEDPGVIKFTRCNAYRNLLIERGYLVDTTIVQNFEIENILQIIEKYNGNESKRD